MSTKDVERGGTAEPRWDATATLRLSPPQLRQSADVRLKCGDDTQRWAELHPCDVVVDADLHLQSTGAVVAV